MGEKGKQMADQLDDFLTPAAPAEPEPTPEPTGEPEPETTPPVETPAPTPSPDIEGLKAAMIAERRARQDAERRAQELEAAQQQKPDFWEDPEGRLAEVESRFEQRIMTERLNLSEAFAREKYSDFQEKLDTFAALVQDNPALYHQMQRESNPAEFAYRTASNQLKLKEMGDPSQYEAKLRADIEAKVKAEYEAKLAEELKKRTTLPGSLSDARGVGGATPPAFAGPTPLTDILK